MFKEKVNDLQSEMNRLQNLENFMLNSTKDSEEKKKTEQLFVEIRDNINICLDGAFADVEKLMAEFREKLQSRVMEIAESGSSPSPRQKNVICQVSGSAFVTALAKAHKVQFENVKAQKIADVLNEKINVSARTIQRWYSGHNLPSIDKLNELLKGVPEDYILQIKNAYVSAYNARGKRQITTEDIAGV